jgi:Ca2+-transporting ATPase
MNADPQSSEDHRWHALEGTEALALLAVAPQRGLSPEEADRRRVRYGANTLPEPVRRSILSVFVRQFQSPLIYLLFGAAALALVVGEISDAIVIFVVVLLNAAVGAFQEGRAEHALAALRRLATQKAHVVRDGHELVVDARELVPGDIMLLSAGDAVTADARLIEGASLQVSEAALTGESVPVPKAITPLTAGAALADRASMVYAGTLVTAGRARAVVTATGVTTEIGHIASLAETTRSQKTPLERRIDQFGRFVMVGALAMFVLFIAIGALRGLAFADIMMIGISQVVGLIPEGLPVAMTIALAVGVQRMARRRAIVRRLSAVETLGSTTVICSDKTGTLTRNEMTVTAVWLPAGREIDVTGSGYKPEGELRWGARKVELSEDRDLGRLFEAVVLCNDAHVAAPDDHESAWRPVGDPTEAALVTLALKGGLSPDELRKQLPRRAEIPFDSAIKMMATQHDTPAGRRVVVKGAAEMVLELCGQARVDGELRALDQDDRDQVRTAVEGMASRALRVLAVAELENADLAAGFAELRGRATLLGLVGQIDPPRAEAIVAVATCRSAGVRPVMVTGDHAVTGVAVARTLDIARESDLAIDGTELDTLSEDALAQRLDNVAVFARVHPAQKLRIVGAYQKRGEVVAMTGDGVNDAPALVRANVGVAMGITGTDAAKQAAKVIITDDNFGTIVAAIEEGRIVYRNIKKAVLLLFATSLSEVFVLLLAMLLGYPPPFAAVQILWNNLVTESVITVNLVMEPAEGDEMQGPPTRTGEALVTRSMWMRVAIMTPAIVVTTLGWYLYRTSSGVPFDVARTETFTLLAVCEWFNVLNCLSDRRSALSLRLLRNRWLLGGLVVGNVLQIAVVYVPAFNRVFYTVPLGIEQVLAIGAVGSLVLWVEELRKLIVRARSSSQRATAVRWEHATR